MIAALEGPPIGWFDLSPLLVLLGAALVMLVVGALLPRWPRGLYAAFTATAAGATMVLAMVLWDDVSDQGARYLVGDAVTLDGFSMFATIAIAATVLLACLVTDDYLRREQLDGPEVYALYLTAGIGGIVMAMANDLVVLFLGLEVLSLSFYVLAASHRRRSAGQESAIKYFVLGGFASAFFLYGAALVYGGTGSVRYDEIVAAVNTTLLVERKDALVLAGVALLIVGLAFKVSAVPFHFWAPDVYQGAPTPVTAFMASAGKIGAFAAMLRVLTEALPQWRDDWRPVVWTIAVATLAVGSILAVVQTNVKRMLAYSSISHAGFILVGVEAAGHTAGEADPSGGVAASMLYLLLYAVLVMGTFAVVSLVGRTGDDQTDLDGFRGLGRTRPALALGMTVLLLAQAGVPLTSGFVAKFGVISAAVDQRSYAIAIVAMLASVIAAFLYLRIMVSMWIVDAEAGDDAREAVRTPLSTSLAVVLSVGFTLVVGFAPGWIVSAAEHATTIATAVAP
ncbi:MAG: NADH-quinone oxidoreductase subunit N [Acidimicrobiales bacterium]|nr:NADH-quinone oxidoreductase subunit N [Acidimicrobiales bacterium]MCB9392085.1 NADH-quinone oxidoreductase subunit N [Acidimicrobiaceae bacterium]